MMKSGKIEFILSKITVISCGTKKLELHVNCGLINELFMKFCTVLMSVCV